MLDLIFGWKAIVQVLFKFYLFREAIIITRPIGFVWRIEEEDLGWGRLRDILYTTLYFWWTKIIFMERIKFIFLRNLFQICLETGKQNRNEDQKFVHRPFEIFFRNSQIEEERKEVRNLARGSPLAISNNCQRD